MCWYDHAHVFLLVLLCSTETAENRFWKKFRNSTSKHFAKVSSITFCPSKPYDFAVTAATRVALYESKTCTIRRTITRFRDTAYGASWRDDGTLIVSGCEDHCVYIHDSHSRVILRTLKGHTQPVHHARFIDMTHVISSADDSTSRYWDMATEQHLATLKQHTDYVRCGTQHPTMSDTWISASYDHTIRMWDLRTSECVMTMKHGAPVEDILCLPQGGLLISAGENQLKVWDLLTGGTPRLTLSNHQKTITSLALDSASSRLISGSLDHLVKFYDITDYSVTHTIKYEQPVLSVALSPSNNVLAVGMSDGTLSIRKKEKSKPKSTTPIPSTSELSVLDDDEHEPQPTDSKKESASFSILDFAKTFLGASPAETGPGMTAPRSIRTGRARFFERGSQYEGKEEDYRVESVRKAKLRPYDQQLKKFQYHQAVDMALETHSPVIIASVLDELIDRSALTIALSGRDDISLEPILRFCIKYIGHPYYANLVCDVTNIIADMYSAVLGSSPLISSLILLLSSSITRETSCHRTLLSLQGSVSALIHASGTSSSSSSSSSSLMSDPATDMATTWTSTALRARDSDEPMSHQQLITLIQQRKRKGTSTDASNDDEPESQSDSDQPSESKDVSSSSSSSSSLSEISHSSSSLAPSASKSAQKPSKSKPKSAQLAPPKSPQLTASTSPQLKPSKPPQLQATSPAVKPAHPTSTKKQLTAKKLKT